MTQFVHGEDCRFSGAVQDVEDSCLSGLSVQGHLKHVERDLLQGGPVPVDCGKESLPCVFVLVLKEEIEKVHEATVAAPTVRAS